MRRTSPAATQEVLAGFVERVTFHNAENGFCVLRIKARGHRELVTVVGHAAAVAAGEWVTASGNWVNDRTHGQQFRARFLRMSAPSSVDGIEKYLGSGMIRGIGPVYARKLVRTFGDKVFDIIEAEPARLREVDGIGPVRARRIAEAWAEQRVVREIMVFLHGQATRSRIIVNAHRINEGAMPELGRPDGESDFYFVPADDPETAVARILELVRSRIPQRFGLDPARDIQVLCPMN